jgi:uncharacterized protein YbjT (DUF2867 family)
MEGLTDGLEGPLLVAGAGGLLGTEILRVLAAHGVRCRATTRNPAGTLAVESPHIEVIACDLERAADAARAVAGVRVVVSCVGGSLDLRAFRDRGSYESVDHAVNGRLLEAAVAAGVRRFVYVSVFSPPALSHTAYVRAHEKFAAELRQAPMQSVVVRPTGFFHSYLEMLRMAESGRGIVIGSGEARTNPIHEADVAVECVRALTCEEATIDAGGPEILTRREIQALAFRALDREPRITHLPAAPFTLGSALVRPFHPRLGELLEFGTVASTVDIVAPARGRRDLESYMRAAARNAIRP